MLLDWRVVPKHHPLAAPVVYSGGGSTTDCGAASTLLIAHFAGQSPLMATNVQVSAPQTSGHLRTVTEVSTGSMTDRVKPQLTVVAIGEMKRRPDAQSVGLARSIHHRRWFMLTKLRQLIGLSAPGRPSAFQNDLVARQARQAPQSLPAEVDRSLLTALDALLLHAATSEGQCRLCRVSAPCFRRRPAVRTLSRAMRPSPLGREVTR